MRFDYESQQLAHPQACLIPRSLMGSEFRYEVSELQLNLMTTPWEEIAARIAGLKDHTPVNKVGYWLCTLLGHPSASDTELMHMADELGIPKAKQFGLAAATGRLTLINQITAVLPVAEQLSMIKADEYRAFRDAAVDGHIQVMERLITLAPGELQNMLKAKFYLAFSLAASNGHLVVLEKYRELDSDAIPNMIKAQRFLAFGWAIKGGHVAIMEWLMAQAPDEVQDMIRSNGYYAFSMAAEQGNLPLLERLISLLSAEDVLNMILADSYQVFGCAARGGHLHVMQRLMALAPAEMINMVTYDNNRSFCQAAMCHTLSPAVSFLLSFSTVMAYAEQHENEYGYLTHPFINNKLTSLRSQRRALEEGNPHAVFDITDVEEAKNCFYIIRNLIRRNDPTLLDDIRFLLEIPAVKALAHVEGTIRPNELIYIAVIHGNEAAAEILLTIPAVREIAARNDYYRAVARGALDLGALARDRESSMHALTTGEQQRLAAASGLYQPILRADGVDTIFNNLREALVRRYQEHPATIILDGVATVLPVTWEAFEHLELASAQRQEALKAYYQHKDHSALRYLSNPNQWMAPDASYVYINEAHTQRWATFEEYKPLISMLWLAAKDETIAPDEGHTLEGRITHFIDELAHIGRAHNWDHSRDSVDLSGHSTTEEFDDLAGDKPSCFSGVKRRLFQSVIGHPLLKILTEQDIQQELRDFVRAHFARLITDENRGALHKSWNDYCLSVELADAEHLRMLNISSEQQAAFIAQLTTKYGHQFSSEAKFRNTITTAFTLVESASNPADCMHALKFSGLVNLGQLLQAPVAGAGAASASTVGFFAEGASQTAVPTANPAADAGVNSLSL